MNTSDFIKLNGLLAKLNVATNKAAETDGSFKKYYGRSIEMMNELQHDLKNLEQGLKIAKIVKPE